MLLPYLRADLAGPGLGLFILFEQDRDMPHGFFGDRDAGNPANARPRPPAAGLFGRLSDDPPLRPANHSPTDRPRPDDPRRRG